MPAQLPTVHRMTIAVSGIVQGVGFRPFVYNAAQSAGLSGWVSNDADTVRIEVLGAGTRRNVFLDRLGNHHPPPARHNWPRPTRHSAAHMATIVGEAGQEDDVRPVIDDPLAVIEEEFVEDVVDDTFKFGFVQVEVQFLLDGIVPGSAEFIEDFLEGVEHGGVDDIGIAMTVMEANVREVKDVYELSRKLGVDFSITVATDSEVYFGEGKASRRPAYGEELRRGAEFRLRRHFRSFGPLAVPRAWF